MEVFSFFLFSLFRTQGISFHTLAPKYEKEVFSALDLECLMQSFFDGEEHVLYDWLFDILSSKSGVPKIDRNGEEGSWLPNPNKEITRVYYSRWSWVNYWQK